MSLPDDLDEEARRAGLNVSELTRTAIHRELDRRQRIADLRDWLDELDAAHGEPSAEAKAEAQEWVAGLKQKKSSTGRRSVPPVGRVELVAIAPVRDGPLTSSVAQDQYERPLKKKRAKSAATSTKGRAAPTRSRT